MPLRPRHAVIILIALLSAAVAGGCGASKPSKLHDVTLALDFTPNAVHAPIYAAVRKGFDRSRGIDLRIREPGEGPDGLKLVATGRAQLALLDISDLALAEQQGVDVVAVAALVGKPLAALIAQHGIGRPRNLEHKTVGVSGLPSDPAFLKAVMQADGGDVRTVHQVTIGFSAVQRLLTGRVAAVPAFWNVEGVALQQRGHPVDIFKVEDYGAPPYPEVVIVTSRATLAKRRADIRAALAAISAGVGDVRAHPAPAVAQIVKAAGAADPKLVAAQLHAVIPTYAPGLRLDRPVLERWATWDAKVGIVKRRPDIAKAFAFGLTGS